MGIAGISGISFKILLLLGFLFQASTAAVEVKNPQIRVMAFGDLMMHKPITNSGYNRKTGTYQFEPIFEEVKPLFSNADLVIGNLETPLADENFGFSGYPRFNGPKEIALALKNAGVDILTTANNHALDQREIGVIQTLNHLDKYGILHTGTFRSDAEKNQPLIIEKEGVKLGIIAYTYGTNGIPIPKDKPYLVNILNMDSVKKDVQKLQAKNVDYILAMIHYGVEYQRLPNKEQEMWTKELLANGIDFVLGSHSHVVQPLKLYQNDKISSDKGVIYSMGNFLSNQQGNWKDYGAILNLLIEKDIKNNRVIIKEATVIPTFVQRKWNGKREYRIIPLNSEEVNIDAKIKGNGKKLENHVYGW